jgi:hypothetical protein
LRRRRKRELGRERNLSFEALRIRRVPFPMRGGRVHRTAFVV